MVDLNLQELYAKQLSPSDVSNALSLQNIILPAGTAKFAQTEYPILLNGSPLPWGSIQYAGVTPGFAGLYQINVVLPDVLPSNPQIQVVIGTQASPPAILLFTN